DNVFSALASVQRLQTQFKQLIVANPADPVWVSNLVPTTPVLDLPSEPKLDDLIVSALRNRPEVAQLRASEDSAATNLGYAKDQLKPQIDLNLGVEEDGFAGVPSSGSSNPIVSLLGEQTTAINTLLTRAGNPLPQISTTGLSTTPAYQNGRFGQAWTNLFNGRYPTYTAGLTISLPLGNRTAKANFAAAQESAKQVAVQEVALLQRIRGEALNAVQQFRETQYRLAAARRAREASERVLSAEQRRFNVGSSTTYLVLQRQLEVANNSGRELQAQTDLNNSVVELNRVSGTLFTAYNVDARSLGAKTLDAAALSTSSLPSAKTSPSPATPLK
ncbi:MAG: TolC family protein, partial [Candidatus Eremiobacteraeota bacterium]|nr:TolC family protein [Candidatus Eremiobacteraeota bacterium]